MTLTFTLRTTPLSLPYPPSIPNQRTTLHLLPLRDVFICREHRRRKNDGPVRLVEVSDHRRCGVRRREASRWVRHSWRWPLSLDRVAPGGERVSTVLILYFSCFPNVVRDKTMASLVLVVCQLLSHLSFSRCYYQVTEIKSCPTFKKGN